MLNKRSEIELILFNLAAKHGICLEQYTHSGNHLHLLIKANTREGLQNFLKSFARQVAQVMVGLNRKFWTNIVYSRIVEWGRDLKNVIVYIIRNFLEISKQIPYLQEQPPPFLLLE